MLAVPAALPTVLTDTNLLLAINGELLARMMVKLG